MATKKRKCAFGDKCYRKNKEHFEEYEHSSKKKKRHDEEIETTESKAKIIEKSELNLEINLCANEAKDIQPNAQNVKNLIIEQNKMEMPDDFFDFLEFCRFLDKNNPKNALKVADLELVGIYDFILSDFKTDYKVYCRYFYDVPEFQTVIKGSDETLLHFGYFRDDPNKLPDFVAINEAKIDCKIISKGENLFSAVNWYLDELLKITDSNKTKIVELKELKKQLASWCEKESKFEWPLQLKTPKLKIRDEKINCKTFHGSGICVAVNEQGFGYREVPESYDSLKKMFNNFCSKGDAPNLKAKKSKAEESIQELMTLTQFANDESDYGMALELGQCMFSFGEQGLHKYIKNLLSISYTLLDRNHYSDVVKAHMSNRLMKIIS